MHRNMQLLRFSFSAEDFSIDLLRQLFYRSLCAEKRRFLQWQVLFDEEYLREQSKTTRYFKRLL